MKDTKSPADPAKILDTLFTLILERKGADPKTSYVAALYAKGTPKIAQKLGEEAVETAIAALSADKDAIAQEAADLLFHLLVLLADRGLTLSDVLDVLEKRLGTSGHDEKAARQE